MLIEISIEYLISSFPIVILYIVIFFKYIYINK